MVGQIQLYVLPPDARDPFFICDADFPHFRVTDVLSAALDSGLAVAIILIFFLLQYPKNGTIGSDSVQTWWGNRVYLDTADGQKLPYKTLPAGATFG